MTSLLYHNFLILNSSLAVSALYFFCSKKLCIKIVAIHPRLASRGVEGAGGEEGATG